MEASLPQKPLFYETAARWLARWIRESKTPLLAAMITGLLSYTFAFTNKFVNHDEAYNLFGKGATLDSGRWGLALLDNIFPNYSMPWIYGILTIALIAVASAVVVRILDIRSKPLQALLAGSIIAFPSLIGTFAFMFTSSAYGLSFLLSVVPVLLLQKREWYFHLLALGCLIFSVAIYQSYIAVAAALLILELIARLLRGEPLGSTIRRGFAYVGFLILSLGLYFVLMKLSLLATGRMMNAYSNDRVNFSVLELPQRLAFAYTQFLQFFTIHRHGLIPTEFSCKVHVYGLIFSGILLVLWAVRRKERSIGRLLLLIALIALLPAAINCMYLFTSPTAIHTLVLYGFVAVYLLMILVADVCARQSFTRKLPEGLRRLLVNGVVLCLCLILALNIYLSNISFLALHLKYETTYSFYTSLIAELRTEPEFDENTKLAVLGRWPQPEHFEKYLYYLDPIFGLSEAFPDIYSRDKFIQYYLSVDIPMASPAEEAAILESEEYRQMPAYPYYGSAKMIGDIYVVKLS